MAIKKKETKTIKSTNFWLYEKRKMQNQAVGILGKRVPIRDVPESMSCVGFVSNGAIYLKEHSFLTDKLTDAKTRAIHFGLFVEGLAHIAFTDYKYLNEVMKTKIGDLEKIDDMEELRECRKMQNIFLQIFNTCELPALESLVPTLLSGHLLDCLKYTIKRKYDVSAEVHSKKTDYEQVIQAMEHFSFMGPVKGHFDKSESKRYFFKTMALMNKIIKTSDAKERINLAFSIYELLTPLWKDLIDDESFDLDNLLGDSSISTSLEAILAGFATLSEGSSEIDPEELADNADLSKGAMRKTTWEKVEKLENEEEKKEREEWMKSMGLDPEEEEFSSNEGEHYASGSGDDETIERYSDEPIDLSRPADYDPEFEELTLEAMDFIDRLIQAEIEMDTVDTSPTASATVPDFPEVSKKYSSREYKCKNIFVNIESPAKAKLYYDEIVKKNLSRINTCYKKLNALFKEDKEEKEYRSSGKLSIKRTMSGSVTPKLFTKAADPKDISSMAVTILIDQSGSMNGSRIERAKEAAISFAEIFGKLGVPTYTLGFTSDTKGADVIHYHYGTWENKPADRTKLTSIAAEANNFDGYSIRYASKVLSMRPEAHKILIVISDGQPACSAYKASTGYNDTKDAIRECRTSGQIVLGVAIGADVATLHKMYGNDFIFVETSENLFLGIMKKFTAMVKKW